MLPHFPNVAELKKAGRGSYEEKMAVVGETTLHVAKWHDNRSVTHKQKIITKVTCPAVVKGNKKNMGGSA